MFSTCNTESRQSSVAVTWDSQCQNFSSVWHRVQYHSWTIPLKEVVVFLESHQVTFKLLPAEWKRRTNWSYIISNFSFYLEQLLFSKFVICSFSFIFPFISLISIYLCVWNGVSNFSFCYFLKGCFKVSNGYVCWEDGSQDKIFAVN